VLDPDVVEFVLGALPPIRSRVLEIGAAVAVVAMQPPSRTCGITSIRRPAL